MRKKIENILGYHIDDMWVGTFHGLTHRVLRAYWKNSNLQQNFQILDGDDQQRILKRIVRNMEIDVTRWPAKQAQSYINAKKNEGLRVHNIYVDNDLYSQKMLLIYKIYEKECQRAGVIDFGEILLRCHEMWSRYPDILAVYQRRFQQILVDEFQDTNTVQYSWLQLLAGDRGHLFIVGDNDQSIYGWRGARIKNIQDFNQKYKDTTSIKLEQNYRSTGNILAAANAVISNNSKRPSKKLWTTDKDGDLIQLYQAHNERDEAAYIVEKINLWLDEGGKRADNAILYRLNAQARMIEEALLQANIPYYVYGGLCFFERAEIKDVLSYLRLISNRNDDAAFERIVNKPTRGIGASALSQLRQYAHEQKLTLWQSAVKIINSNSISTKNKNAISSFLILIDSLEPKNDKTPLNELTDLVIDKSNLRVYFSKDKTERGQGRTKNINQLIESTSRFNRQKGNEHMSLLNDFLSYASLETGEKLTDRSKDCVQLMTLHSAKGLEFPEVFMIGMEEGILPRNKFKNDTTSLSEERRLCYVGITRAKKILHLIYTETRYLYKKKITPVLSRFIKEIPTERLRKVCARKNIADNGNTPIVKSFTTLNETNLKSGQQVHHPKFGSGIIVDTEDSKKSFRVKVNFKNAGNKWLVLDYAKLKII